VNHLTLKVPRGVVFGFLGPNGSGKTTTIRLLLRLLDPTSGSAEVLGYDVRTQAGKVREHTGALLEHNGLYERTSPPRASIPSLRQRCGRTSSPLPPAKKPRSSSTPTTWRRRKSYAIWPS
jgi:ABC-type phosphate/phosphonate transport system ATPase subunit